MANPILSSDVLNRDYNYSSADYMTLGGTVNKCITLSLIVILFAMINVYVYTEVNTVLAFNITIASSIVGFIIALIITFKKHLARVLAIVYAALEGIALGGLSIMFESLYSGIIFQAVVLTMAVLFTMLILYKFRVIRVTEKFRSVIFVATLSIALVYFVSFILRLFSVRTPFLYDASPIGIGVSVVIVIVAALNLLLDFDFIERGSESNMPKYFEWYAAFGLLVTLVWLYIEILKLLSKVRSRR